MKEIYDLNRLPLDTTIPHDCVIKEINMIENKIEFIFEDNISDYESISENKNKFKSLIMKFNLLDQDFSVYIWQQPKKGVSKNGCYELLDNNVIQELPKSRLEYISHNIGYNSIVIRLFSETYGNVILDLDVSSVEYEWIV